MSIKKKHMNDEENFNKIQISVVLPDFQIKYLKVIAKKNLMSRTAYIRKLIQADLEKNIQLMDK